MPTAAPVTCSKMVHPSLLHASHKCTDRLRTAASLTNSGGASDEAEKEEACLSALINQLKKSINMVMHGHAHAHANGEGGNGGSRHGAKAKSSHRRRAVASAAAAGGGRKEGKAAGIIREMIDGSQHPSARDKECK